MNIRKIFIVLLLPLLAEVMLSCCPCEDSYTEFYSHVTFNLQNLDNSGAHAAIWQSGPIPAAAYGIRLNIARQQTDSRQRIFTQGLMVQNALATSCDCPPPLEILPQDSITDMRFITLEDFDFQHPAESDVSHFFRVRQYNSYLSIAQFLEQTRWTLFSEEEYLLQVGCLLMQPPASGTTHRFRVRIFLSDGRVLENETIPVELKP